MSENEFSDMLDNLEGMYDETPPQSLDTVPDGEYQLRIEEADTKIVEKPDGKVLNVVMKYTVAAGELAGKALTTWDRLNTEQGVKFWKEKLRRLGLPHDTPLKELPVILAEMPGLLVTAMVKNTQGTRGDMIFTNVYIRSCDGRDESMPI